MNGGDADKAFDSTGLSEEEVKILESEGSDEESIAPEEVAAEAPKAETAKPKPHENPDRPKDYVPIQALREARNELKETQKRLKEFESFQREIAAKLLAERQAQAEPESDNPPNPDENPFQTLKWVQQQLVKQQEQAKQQEQLTLQQQQEEQRLNEFRMDVAREFDEAAAEDEDLQESFQYLQGFFKHEYDTVYARTGIPFEKYQADTILNHSIFARNSGVTIAEYVRNLAVARGWSPGVLRNNAAAVAAASKGPTPATERIEKIAQAQDRNASLGKSSGTDGGEISLETLSKMSGSQLEKFVAKHPDLIHKLTGIPA